MKLEPTHAPGLFVVQLIEFGFGVAEEALGFGGGRFLGGAASTVVLAAVMAVGPAAC
jgi:hypothetical protein